MPHAVEQLCPRATTREPNVATPRAHVPGAHVPAFCALPQGKPRREACTLQRRVAPLAATAESPHAARTTQHGQKLISTYVNLVFKNAFAMISLKQAVLQVRKLSSVSPHDLLKTLQRVSVPKTGRGTSRSRPSPSGVAGNMLARSREQGSYHGPSSPSNCHAIIIH